VTRRRDGRDRRADGAAIGAQRQRRPAARETSVERVRRHGVEPSVVAHREGCRTRAPSRAARAWSTRPLADAPYYAYRASYGTPTHAVEAELVHHKLTSRTPRPGRAVEVTHGYNLATANAARPPARCRCASARRRRRARRGHVGGLPVGRRRTTLGGGYHVAGATAQLAVGRRYLLRRGAVAPFAAPEVKLTATRRGCRSGRVREACSCPTCRCTPSPGLGARRLW
jgi:hypothetical protein